ncbi:ABC transporter permease [Consotaella salsifontis]|uniref:Putative ABC transport system permease protein n=1 Tax=Consotaella salsifontis TaxID=1365950 RepID=A0A1T4RRH0_9HYPH|nr:ABC transporter permease [Consotaella salsifontis]SKA18589.1 putative ABC transport system permease protein [Consotaella salsifontis]
MFRFIAADLKRNLAGAAIVALIIALATALGVAVTLQERALRLGSARAASAFDLVIGAPGSETQLVLSSVFLQAAPLPLVPGTVLSGLARDPRVAWAAPIGFGDFAGDSPIVGTTAELVAGMGGVSEGQVFSKLGEALVGALADHKIGDAITPLHGRLGEGGHAHAEARYTVVGRLKPTGTPWDHAVLVPIEAVWAIHEHHDEDEEEHEGAEHHEEEEHEHHLDFSRPIDPAALSAPEAPGLPAILVKPKTFADAYKLRMEYRTDRTLAVFPGEVLTRLYGTLGDARRVLTAVAAGAQGLVAASILLVVVVHILQRRRQIGALRAFGAPRGVVFSIVFLETFAVIGVGVLAGFGLGWLAARSISSILTEESGIAMPVVFTAEDWLAALALLAATVVIAAIPSALAYRQSPAEALRG